MFKKTLFRSILYLHIIGFTLLFSVLFTQSGLVILYKTMRFFVPGNLTIADIHGRLVDTTQLDNVEYTSKQFSFRAKSITLKGQLPALFNKNIRFPTLLIKNGVLTFSQAPNDSLDISQLKLTVEYSINNKSFSAYLENIEGSFKEGLILGSGYTRIQNQTFDWLEFHGSWGIHQFDMKTYPDKIVDWTWTNGQLSATGSFNILPQYRLTGNARMVLPKTTWDLALPGKQIYKLRYSGEITATLNEQSLNFSFQVKEHSKNSLSGQVALPKFKLTEFWKEQTLEGTIVGRAKDLSITYLLVPVISRLKAELNLLATLKGTLTNPIIHLDAKINEGIFSVPQQHITIKHFSLHVDGDFPGTIAINSTGILSGNPFTLRGTVNSLSLNTAAFDLKGKDLKIYNTENIQITASPQLFISYDEERLKITGEVDIPSANITILEELNQVVHSNDVRIIDKKAMLAPTHSLYIDPNITLLIDDTLHFKGHGLDAVIGGKLQIEKRHDGLYTGTGRLMIRQGKYRLQGSMGHIRHGRLLFPGGTLLNNPILDIRIAKKQERLEDSSEVGIYVQGSLLKPMFSAYSNDNLQNSEILSQLGFGTNQTDANNGRQLLSQSAWLLNSGASPLIDRLQNKFGLEEIGIQPRQITNNINIPGGVDSYLVVGKSLTDKLYLQFLQSMMEQSTWLRLKYYLTPNLTISLEKGTEGMGTDLSFSVEKD